MFYRALRRFTILKALLGREPFHLARYSGDLEFHGSSYGGWSIIPGSLDSSSVVYSVGIGHDVSFDLSLIRQYGCRILAFDPTPSAVEWAAENVRHPLFELHPFALADHGGDLNLYLPQPNAADSVSASIYRTGAATDFVTVPCRTFGNLLAEHSGGRCDLLKMDIEGAEYGVIREATARGSLEGVRQLLVEFHHWMPDLGASATIEAVRTLRKSGFQVAWVSRTNHEYLFVRNK
ncbi:MAG: FkbM family methyltransferase [Verrucomicrobia bacterium]|nr:FkbM family methyltransferase [Verrucomicrobiota bacterium]